MRIAGGHAKGRILSTPKGGSMRITTDRVKQSLFDILGPLDGYSILDLYAGTGSVGIEGLSRGAARCVFVEIEQKHAVLIEKNCVRCRVDGAEVLHTSVEKALKHLRDSSTRFDIIFADPPYGRGLVSPTLEGIGAAAIMTEDGLVVVEHSLKEQCESTERLFVSDERRYGDTVITFLKTTL